MGFSWDLHTPFQKIWTPFFKILHTGLFVDLFWVQFWFLDWEIKWMKDKEEWNFEKSPNPMICWMAWYGTIYGSEFWIGILEGSLRVSHSHWSVEQSNGDHGPIPENTRYHSTELSRLMTRPTKWHVRPAKTQISLGGYQSLRCPHEESLGP